MINETQWETMSTEEKKRQLFLNQKATLDSFLERGAITKAQYDKSYGDLKLKMGFEGDAYVQEISSPETRMDMQLEYLITRKVQIGTVKGSYYGVYHSLVK